MAHIHRKQNMNAFIHKSDISKKEETWGGKGDFTTFLWPWQSTMTQSSLEKEEFIWVDSSRGRSGARGLASGTHNTGS